VRISPDESQGRVAGKHVVGELELTDLVEVRAKRGDVFGPVEIGPRGNGGEYTAVHILGGLLLFGGAIGGPMLRYAIGEEILGTGSIEGGFEGVVWGCLVGVGVASVGALLLTTHPSLVEIRHNTSVAPSGLTLRF
jgi:hypothetical protein